MWALSHDPLSAIHAMLLIVGNSHELPVFADELLVLLTSRYALDEAASFVRNSASSFCCF
jgi:hypothetical protein